MNKLTLADARAILAGAFDYAAKAGLKPMGVVVVDARGATKAFEAQDGSALKRYEIAHGKAHGAVATGIGSRALFRRAQEQPFFVAGVAPVVGAMIPVPGGVLIRDGEGKLVGAVGASGDTADNDEACAVAGIQAAGFSADPG